MFSNTEKKIRHIAWFPFAGRVLILVLVLLSLTACPPAPKDPVGRMVKVGSFEIDATEVTREQYAEFLNAGVSFPDDLDCVWNNSREPSCEWTAGLFYDLPANCINWCNARDYCEWVGKRLCSGDMNDPDADEWYIACSDNGAKKYPYGNEYRADYCNGYDFGTLGPEAPAHLPDCEGGVGGLYDMSGNLIEWTGICRGDGAEAFCVLRGGGFNNDAEVLSCGYDFGRDNLRSVSNELIGFRCCRDLEE